jgi:hypothetical protein
MTAMKRWQVEIILGEDDGRTYAEARLHTEIGVHLLGIGRAKLNPHDYDVPEIGDEIAVARALTDLGHRLLITAAMDLEQVTQAPVELTH